MSNKSPDLAFAEKDKPSFWLLHTLGWSVYIVIFSFDNLVFTFKEEVNPIVILSLCISAFIAFMLTLPMRYIFRRCWTLNARQLILSIACLSLIAALIWTPSKNVVMWSIIDDDMQLKLSLLDLNDVPSPFALLNGLSYSFFMILVWCTLYFGINYHYRLMHEKRLHLDAIRLSHHAQIKMLRYQINPHFLFNTLNAISTLVLQDNKEKANGMLTRLSTFLRFSLDNDPEKKIALYDEIKAIMLYLEIEKTRFEDRLKIDLKVEPEAEQLYVPSLILQPLVENSIKHGIAKSASGGVVCISAKCEQSYLHLQVSDSPNIANGDVAPAINSKKSPNKSCGVGLQNIQDRLSVLYKDAHSFSINCNTEQAFTVDIKIPMERA